jgi:hypothetical protein
MDGDWVTADEGPHGGYPEIVNVLEQHGLNLIVELIAKARDLQVLFPEAGLG